MRLVFDLDELKGDLNSEIRRILLEIANTLINELKAEAPVGATGSLQTSFQIFERQDGKVVLGSRLHYAEAVQTGTAPHTPDWEQIQKWARRVLGDESAAGPVFKKIQAEGTEPNPYVDRAMENTLRQFGGG